MQVILNFMQVFTKENMTWCPHPVLVTVASRPKCSISLPSEPLKWTLETLIPVLAILGILLHLLLTLPAPLFCSKLHLASDPLSLSALVLALRVWWWNLASPYWTSGTLWEQFAHPSSPPSVSDLRLPWPVDPVWLSFSSQRPHSAKPDSSLILLMTVSRPQKGVGWGKWVEGKN